MWTVVWLVCGAGAMAPDAALAVDAAVLAAAGATMTITARADRTAPVLTRPVGPIDPIM